jgi:tRNA nucleotidyltransferase/poly(A) polymerase
MLRAVRFAAAYGFTIEPATLEAIRKLAGEVTTVSAERIGMEMRRMLVDRYRAVAVELLRDANLLAHVLPELDELEAADFSQTLRILSALDTPTLSVALAAMLSRSSRRDAVAAMGQRLRLTNREVERTGWLLQKLDTARNAPHIAWARLQRVLVHEGAGELVALLAAIVGQDDPAVTFIRERLAWPAERLNPAPLIDGAALIEHGLKPGPGFAALLEQVRDAQIEGTIRTREEALALVDRLK